MVGEPIRPAEVDDDLARNVGQIPTLAWRPTHRTATVETVAARARPLGHAHARVANLRRDGLHKLTTRLARQHGTIVVEDLNVAGMLRNRCLARHIADAGFAELRRQLAYKTTWNGGRLVTADRWHPSAKTCSGCGAVKTKPALSERTYTCTTRGMVLDRDLNAARNLAALIARDADTAGSGPVRWLDVEPTVRPASAGPRL